MQVEFILMGGTFMSLPLDYRDFFIRGLHDALSGHMSSSVDEAVKYSEQSHTRCIGLTIETSPCGWQPLSQCLFWRILFKTGTVHVCLVSGLLYSHLASTAVDF